MVSQPGSQTAAWISLNSTSKASWTLAASEERRRTLGPWIAAKDEENCIEDLVSVFEVVLKLLVRRRMAAAGKPVEEIDTFLDREIRSQFQNPAVRAPLLLRHFGEDLWSGIPQETSRALESVFAKRHPITHNLGIADRKYVATAQAGDTSGRDVETSAAEIETATHATHVVLVGLQRRWTTSTASTPPTSEQSA